MKKWIVWVFVVGLVLVMGLWAVSRLLPGPRAAKSEALNTQATPVALDNPADRQKKLMDPGVDLAGRESLMEKIEIQKRVDDNEKAGQSQPAGKDNPANPAPQAAIASSQVETGIFEGSEGMVRPDRALIQNYWRGLVDGKVIMVMAGAAVEDPKQGLVIVIEASLDPTDNAIQFQTIISPLKDGSLRVTNEKENLVTLQTAGGTILQFDVKTRTFKQ